MLTMEKFGVVAKYQDILLTTCDRESMPEK
jgi:hypothetical protein